MSFKKITYGALLSTTLLSSQYAMTTPTYAAEKTGMIWEDQNQNGRLDSGEPGIGNVKMELFNINGALVKSATTNKEGDYSFGTVPNGIYYAKLNIPQQYSFFGTAPNFGSDGLTNYVAVNGNTLTNLNAGLVKQNPEANIEVTAINIKNKNMTAVEGDTGRIEASVKPNNATNKELTYKSKNKNIMTVDKDGNWKAIKAGTTTITVTANNGISKNISVTVTPQIEKGLLGAYYKGVSFNTKVMERIDKDIIIDYLPKELGTENFSIRWTGKIKAPKTGEYKIITNSDDGVRVYINDEAVIDDFTPMSLTKHTSRPISLKENELYTIKIEY
ncbi:PA14 domain-containing protein, partial [Bacillus cereus]|uniref:PA14 domain-containing protein n=1 Tax=Bacillus cereus TaxID=1396 RepID=UPI0015BAE225